MSVKNAVALLKSHLEQTQIRPLIFMGQGSDNFIGLDKEPSIVHDLMLAKELERIVNNLPEEGVREFLENERNSHIEKMIRNRPWKISHYNADVLTDLIIIIERALFKTVELG